ncbi:kinase-like domain-containing protein [Chytridium lagenaria]|nr:kinase-like domain-containing protein [Chytridium lagenaria]
MENLIPLPIRLTITALNPPPPMIKEPNKDCDKDAKKTDSKEAQATVKVPLFKRLWKKIAKWCSKDAVQESSNVDDSVNTAISLGSSGSVTAANSKTDNFSDDSGFEDGASDHVNQLFKDDTDVKGRTHSRTLADFIIEKIIGIGGSGKVLQVKEKSTGKRFALKCMAKARMTKDDYSFLDREVKIMKSLKGYPKFVQLEATFQDNRYFYILTELCTMDLMDYIETHPVTTTSFNFIVRELVDAIGYMHRRELAHLDINPPNIMLNLDAAHNIIAVKLGDFGVSDYGRNFKNGCGTFPFMAPEMFTKSKFNLCADWFSLGVTLYVVLMNKEPYKEPKKFDYEIVYKAVLKRQGKRLKFGKHVDPVTRLLIEGLMHHNPSKRLGNMKHGDAEDVKSHPFFLSLKPMTKSEHEEPILKYYATDFTADMLMADRSVWNSLRSVPEFNCELDASILANIEAKKWEEEWANDFIEDLLVTRQQFSKPLYEDVDWEENFIDLYLTY